VVSVQIYNHVEAMEYSQAHGLAGGLLLFSFVVLLLLYSTLKTSPVSPLK
jgi:molybdate transport system permease protein